MIEIQLIHKHINLKNILQSPQSSFRSGYSCTIPLRNWVDDIIESGVAEKSTPLVLYDFSKAFNTNNHIVLIALLKSTGSSPITLNLLQSYLERDFRE